LRTPLPNAGQQDDVFEHVAGSGPQDEAEEHELSAAVPIRVQNVEDEPTLGGKRTWSTLFSIVALSAFFVIHLIHAGSYAVKGLVTRCVWLEQDARRSWSGAKDVWYTIFGDEPQEHWSTGTHGEDLDLGLVILCGTREKKKSRGMIHRRTPQVIVVNAHIYPSTVIIPSDDFLIKGIVVFL